MVGFLVLTAVTFSLFGFIIGLWADGFEKLQIVPLMIVTPLTFLGGSFYSINMLPPFWQKITLFNPVVYLVSGFRWSFYGISDVDVGAQPRHDAGVPGAVPGGDRGGSSGPATGSRRDGGRRQRREVPVGRIAEGGAQALGHGAQLGRGPATLRVGQIDELLLGLDPDLDHAELPGRDRGARDEGRQERDAEAGERRRPASRRRC